MKFFLLAYSEPKSYNIGAMGKYREWITKLAVGFAFLAFVCLGSFLWDRNENAYDARMDRLYNEGVPVQDNWDLIMALFHIFFIVSAVIGAYVIGKFILRRWRQNREKRRPNGP